MSEDTKPESNEVVSNVKQVTLGGVVYDVAPLTLGLSQAWRKEFSEPITAIIEGLQNAPNLDVTDFQAVGALLGLIQGTLLGSLDLLFDMLCKYAPNIEKDKKRILDTATDDEVMVAFIEVLKLAYPFGRLAGVFTMMR